MSRYPGPAFGLLELESLARGVVVADALVKKAAVRISTSEPVSPGKYLLVFSGPVAEVDESFRAGVEAAGPKLIDQLFLSHIDERIIGALSGAVTEASSDDSLGIVETHTVASTILAADSALKRSGVALVGLELAKGIGGKGWFTLAGPLPNVEAALEGAAAAIEPSLLVATELIARPHRDVHQVVRRPKSSNG